MMASQEIMPAMTRGGGTYRIITPAQRQADRIDPVIAACRTAFERLGPMPDDEDGPDMQAWEARSNAAWRQWEALIRTEPTTIRGCIALAGFVAGHDLARNLDGNDGPQIALVSISSALATMLGASP